MKNTKSVQTLSNLYAIAATLSPTQRSIVGHLFLDGSNKTADFTPGPIATLAAKGFVVITHKVTLTAAGKNIGNICAENATHR